MDAVLPRDQGFGTANHDSVELEGITMGYIEGVSEHIVENPERTAGTLRQAGSILNKLLANLGQLSWLEIGLGLKETMEIPLLAGENPENNWIVLPEILH